MVQQRKRKKKVIWKSNGTTGAGWSNETNFERVYKATVNGHTVWKKATRNKTTYVIGEEKREYNSEEELIKAIKIT